MHICTLLPAHLRGKARGLWISCCLIVLAAVPAAAQRSGTKFYMSGHLGTEVKGMLYGLSATYIHPSGWGVAAGYRGHTYTATALPGDYESGFCLFGHCTPDDHINEWSLQAVRLFPLPGTKTARILVAGGPSAISYTQAYFTPHPPSGWFSSLAPNYDVHYTTRTAVGASFRAVTSFAFTRGLGMEVGGYTNLNPCHSLFGFEVTLSAGVLRERRRPRKHS